MSCDKLYSTLFVDKNKIQSKYDVIVSKFKMFLELQRYVHNHYDSIIQFALYFYIIVALSTLLVMVWKTTI
jgi:hypothetical protein